MIPVTVSRRSAQSSRPDASSGLRSSASRRARDWDFLIGIGIAALVLGGFALAAAGAAFGS